MAWQSPSAMNAGGANGGDGNAPAGTEYTLQGTAPSVATKHTIPVNAARLTTLQE